MIISLPLIAQVTLRKISSKKKDTTEKECVTSPEKTPGREPSNEPTPFISPVLSDLGAECSSSGASDDSPEKDVGGENGVDGIDDDDVDDILEEDCDSVKFEEAGESSTSPRMTADPKDPNNNSRRSLFRLD